MSQRSSMVLLTAGLVMGFVLGSVPAEGTSHRKLFKGAILLVHPGRSCPSGWETFTSLNGRFPLGGTTTGSGGTSTHSHAVAAHSHAMPSHSHNLSDHSHTVDSHSHSIPSHSHSVSLTTDLGFKTTFGGSSFSNPFYGQASSGNSYHDHSVSGTTGTQSFANTGSSFGVGTSSDGPGSTLSASGNTATTTAQTIEETAMPPYFSMRYCKVK